MTTLPSPPSKDPIINSETGQTTDVWGRWYTLLRNYVNNLGTNSAPSNATYITQKPDSTLTSEQALSLLNSGFVKVTTGSGVLSSTGNTLIQPTDLANTAVTAGSYTVNGVASYTVDAQGRITSSASPVITVTGTAGTITVTGGAGSTPTITIANTYVGQTSITTVGTITTGTWNGTAIANANLANSSVTVNGTAISLGASGTVTAAAGTLTGTTLNSTVVSSSLTSVGTITTGVWNGTILTGTYGGTGINNGAKTLTYLKNISFTAADDTGVYTLPTGTKTIPSTSTDISATGIVTKTNNVAFAASATTDTTNASNISSGTLPAGRLPNPSSSTLGGVQSIAAVTSKWINTISTSGVPSATQPADSDISFSDITTGNASTSNHGFLKKLDNVATHYMGGDGNWTTPTGTAVAAGTIFNFQQGQLTTPTTVTSSSFTDITGISVSITPTSASSTVLVRSIFYVSGNNSSDAFYFRLMRGTTAIGVGTSVGSRTASTAGLYTTINNGIAMFPIVMEWLDSPATTSATTYKVQCLSTSATTIYINSTSTDSNTATYPRTVSTISACEVHS